MPTYKLAEENAQPKSHLPCEEFLRRTKKQNIRTDVKENGWEVIDKEAVKEGMGWDRAEQFKNEWDFVEDEYGMKRDITILGVCEDTLAVGLDFGVFTPFGCCSELPSRLVSYSLKACKHAANKGNPGTGPQSH
jgi:hypothetical protein